MKKILILAICVLGLLTGCGGTKTSITLDDFNTIMVEEGFTVTDNSDKYTGTEEIVSAKVATFDDITIEMVEYTDAEYADQVLEAHIDSFLALKSTAASEQNSKGENYHRYVLVSNGYYMVSSRIDATLIFCKTELANKDKVEEALVSLGY